MTNELAAPPPPTAEIELTTPPQAILAKGSSISLADLMTLVGYGLGIWWSAGGPDWAALASMGLDELDGSVARAMGTASTSGAALDWGADVALTPLALARLARDLEQPAVATIGAPLVLAAQAKMKGGGFRPRVGSARGAVMLATILLHERKAARDRASGRPPRENPTRRRARP
jgi:phosphatidylglycerophosphate synthase